MYFFSVWLLTQQSAMLLFCRMNRFFRIKIILRFHLYFGHLFMITTSDCNYSVHQKQLICPEFFI